MGRRSREAVRAFGSGSGNPHSNREEPPAEPLYSRIEPGVRASGPATPKASLGTRMMTENPGRLRHWKERKGRD